MFAEELSGNASRKRQEQARARRRQLKQSQQKKEREAAAASSASTLDSSDDSQRKPPVVTASTASSSSPLVSQPQPPSAVALSQVSTPATSVQQTAAAAEGGSTASTTSAAAKAIEQRKLRQRAKLMQSSAIVIQSCYRAHQSNARLKKDERALFDRRMNDLMTLGTILKKAKPDCCDYVPPPATASSMATQLLFVTRTIPRRRKIAEEAAAATVKGAAEEAVPMVRGSTVMLDKDDAARLDRLLRCVLLPGVVSPDEDLDPITPWLGTSEGTVRLGQLLCLCLSGLVSPHAEACATAADSFLRAVLSVAPRGEDARNAVVRACRRHLLVASPSTSADLAATVADGTCGGARLRVDGHNLDLLHLLRRLLFFDTGGSDPIPPDAEKSREKCISSKERARADCMFQLVFDAVVSTLAVDDRTEGERLLFQTRFVSEILTVPLLMWKVSALSTSKLITVPKGGKESKPALVRFLHAFAVQYSDAIRDGQIGLVLAHDVPLTVCPAPNVLCLLANLVQLGRLCLSLNGSDASKLDFESAAEYFNFLSTLIDLVPLGAFSSRRSAVEWVTHGKSHHTPIVLSNVIIDLCKTLLTDSYVRALFTAAIDDEELKTTAILEKKNDKDLKHEKDMVEAGSTSAASLAAKEARVDRNRSFWQSSKWGRKLSKTVTSLLSGEGSSKPTASANGRGKLVNTSSISRQLAGGKGAHDRNVAAAVIASKDASSQETGAAPNQKYSVMFLLALCRAYGAVISRWGGGGKEDLVRRVVSIKKTSSGSSEVATGKTEPCIQSLLNVICFSTGIVATLWAVVQSDSRIVGDLYAVIDSDKRAAPIRSLDLRPTWNGPLSSRYGLCNRNVGAVVLFVFVSCLRHVLILTDDCEIHDMEKPLPKHQLRRCILLLKKLLYRACCVDDVRAVKDSDSGVKGAASSSESDYFGLALISAASKMMRDLYDRSSRRPLCVPKLWLEEDLLEKDLRRAKSHQDYTALLTLPVLRVCPFLVSFKRRLQLFERIVTTNRIEVQGSNQLHNLRPGIMVKVSRGRVLEDGLIHLNNLGRNMRQRIVVSYLSQAGAKETGVDVGGLFKEFWTDLSNLAFDPNYALFKATEGSGNCLYPNPSSRAAHGSDHIVLFEFLGRILGKSMYEGITIQPQFAHFFLSFLRGDYNFLHMLPDLGTMDPQLYNNLMFLKTYDGDAADLCLTFTVANDDFGGNQEVPLIPNGANVEVTSSNKHRYIGLVAKHHVCDRVREQSEAFTRGLWEVIDSSWLRLFNEPELQVLISGASDGKIDVSDMKANARYIGGYTGLDRNVLRFWSVVSKFSSKEQADLLRFVTSCERPPPLGFASMNPPFTVQRVGIMRDGDKLPTASTCFNTLKLPTYSSEKVLRERLLYAIQSGAGFELT